MNWISATGRKPCAASPMLMPAISVSASGVSTTRSAPKRSCNPAVARNTPPLTPMSSPSSTTRSIGLELMRERLSDRLDERDLTHGAAPAQRIALLAQRCGQLREQVLEHRRRRARRHGEKLGDGLLDAFAVLASRAAASLSASLQSRSRTKYCLSRTSGSRRCARSSSAAAPIAARIVRGRVVGEPIGQRFDDVRAAAGASLGERRLA